MLNKKPIFLNCFAHGGSTLLSNFLISHPYVCVSAGGETHKIFKGRGEWYSIWETRRRLLVYDLPLRLMIGQNFFDPKLIAPRQTDIPDTARRYIDRILYNGRFRAGVENLNMYQYEGVPYSREELTKCRMVTKGLNGLVFATDLFREMYPDAVFFALVRDGLAMCEGRVRRGQTAADFGQEFVRVVERMYQLQTEMSNYHVLRFEDMTADPLGFLKKLYHLAGLDVGQLKKVRLLARPITTKEGDRKVTMKGGDRRISWYSFDELTAYIRPEINTNQRTLLSKEDRETFMRLAGPTMEKAGYGTDR